LCTGRPDWPRSLRCGRRRAGGGGEGKGRARPLVRLLEGGGTLPLGGVREALATSCSGLLPQSFESLAREAAGGGGR